MNSHDTALEAAAQALADDHEKRTSRKLHRDLFKDTAATAIPAYISALSPDVSGLVERLREMRENWALGSKGPIILTEAADALASLSLQLAAVEKKPLNLGITKEWFEKQAVKEGDLEIGAGSLPEYIPGFIPSNADRYYNRQLSAAITRAETAEASLTAAQEENEQLQSERPWNKAAERASDKQGPIFCAVREALDKAHTACLNHPDRDTLGMSSGPFSGVNYALDAVMSLETSLAFEREENERLRKALEPFADVADFMDSETEGFGMDDELWLGISNDEFPPCHIKSFALQLFYTARAALPTPSKGKDKT